MAFRHAILGLLADGPLHGYDLKARFDRDLGATDALNVGQVYTALDRLHREGQVSQAEVAQAERPDKKVYSLTDAGRSELDAWLTAPSDIDLDLRNDIYLKMMIAHRRGRPDPAQVIAVQRQATLSRLRELMLAQPATRGGPIGTRLLLELAALRLEAVLTWLDRCEAVFRQENPT